jgi:ParB family chromosome partitioning protein
MARRTVALTEPRGHERATEEQMPVEHVRIDWIRVEGRHRKDLGDLTSLAQSMKENDLINPVTVTPHGMLLAGGRRVAAARMLGWTHIDAHVVDTQDDAVKALVIERDENTERLPMRPSDLVALGRALEALERPRAKERQRQAGRIAAAKRLGRPVPPSLSQNPEERTNVDASIARALGTSETNYYYAKSVVNATTDSGRTEDERALAAEAMADMDAGRTTVTGAYERVRKAIPVKTGRKQNPTIDKPAAQRRAIGSAEAALSGIAHALRQIEALHPEITSEEAARWMGSLSESRRAITALISLLKERSNGNT